MLNGYTRHKQLILGLTRRDLFSPFAGSAFGITWALLHPLLQMGVYLVVFTYIFKIRMGGGGSGSLPGYQAYILSGLVAWMAWASLLPSACTSVINSASLVRQADFPAEVLPTKAVLVVLVPHGVSLAVLLLYICAKHGRIPWTWSLLPIAVALQSLAMLGMAYVLSALCVFARDVKELITVFTAMGIFLTPALYPPGMLDGLEGIFRIALLANPFTHFVQMYRDVLYWGELRHPWSWCVCLAMGLIVLYFGQRGFDRLRRFFGNFL